MLGVILKFNDVITPVVAAHQVRLRTSAHSSYVLYGKHHSEACYRAPLLHGKEIFLAVLKFRARLRKRRDAIAPILPPSGSRLQMRQFTSGVPAKMACRIELVGEAISALCKV